MQKVKPLDRRVILVIVACAAALAAWWFLLRPRPTAVVEWQGYAEADFVKVGPTQQGLLTAVHVERGDRIAKGAPLFDQDDADDRASADQIARQLAQAQEQLGNLQSPAKPTEIQQAEANLADAQAARDKVQEDLTRNQALLKTGAASAQIVDQEQADLRSANSKARGLEAMLVQLRAPVGREGEIKAQGAAAEAAQAALAMGAGGSNSATSSRRSAEQSPTCWRGPAKRSPPARRSSRSCRPKTSSCASSCPNRHCLAFVRAIRSRFCATPARPIDGDHFVHRSAGRIHPARHLQRVDARQARVRGRGVAKAE